MFVILLPQSPPHIQKNNPVEYIFTDHLGPLGKLEFPVEMNTSLLYKMWIYTFRFSLS